MEIYSKQRWIVFRCVLKFDTDKFNKESSCFIIMIIIIICFFYIMLQAYNEGSQRMVKDEVATFIRARVRVR